MYLAKTKLPTSCPVFFKTSSALEELRHGAPGLAACR